MFTIYYLGGPFDGTSEEVGSEPDDVILKEMEPASSNDDETASSAEPYILVARDGVTIFAAEKERWGSVAALDEVRRRRALPMDRLAIAPDNVLLEIWRTSDRDHPRQFDVAVDNEMKRRNLLKSRSVGQSV